MKDGPDIARIAALIGDPARANMLAALMDGRALTASELAMEAGVTPQTASSHLARLEEAGLILRERQGRHHYFRLAGPDVAAALEALMHLAGAGRTGRRTRPGPRDPALRRARVCYDHLAGSAGVTMFDAMLENGWIRADDDALNVTKSGWIALARIGVTPASLPPSRSPQCRPCLDWSERRHHLAGRIGRIVLQRIIALNWASRAASSRVISFTPEGDRAFHAWLG